VLGVSVDHIPCLKAWAESLGGIHFPLLSDFWPHGAMSRQYDVLRPEGYSERAIFIIDKAGIIQYIDVHDIDHQPSNETLRQELRRIDPGVAAGASDISQGAEQGELPRGGIVMYCTKWCSDCRRARDWLKSNNLDYIEIDIDANPRAADQVKQWTGGKRITPTFDIEGTILIDFNQQKLNEILKERLVR
jgi:glutaredoxin